MLQPEVPSVSSRATVTPRLLVSIVTIVRNNLDGLRVTSESVIVQTCRDFEWVIVDGASTDGTRDLLEALRPVADIVVSEPDKGIYDAMNKGLGLARGEYVLFMNAGDAFATEDALAKVAMPLKANEARRPAFVLAGAEFRLKYDRYFVQPPRGMDHIWHSVPASHQAILVRTDLHKQVPFDLKRRVAADYDTIARISLMDNSALIVDDVLARVWRGADSNSIRHPICNLRDMATTQREVLKLPRATIAWSTVRRCGPLATLLLLDVPLVSSLVHKMVLLLRPRRSGCRSGSADGSCLAESH